MVKLKCEHTVTSLKTFKIFHKYLYFKIFIQIKFYITVYQAT